MKLHDGHVYCEYAWSLVNYELRVVSKIYLTVMEHFMIIDFRFSAGRFADSHFHSIICV